MTGAFETMRAVDGKVELLDEHVQRLLRGLKVLKIRHRYTLTGLKRAVRQAVTQHPSIKPARVRLMVFVQDGRAQRAVAVLPYRPPTAKQYKKGLRLMIAKTRRPATARWAEVKSLDRGLFDGAYQRAKARGYDDVLLVNNKGHVFESSRANIFIFSGGKLMTPPLSSGCLNGIMRCQVMAAARRWNIPVLEKNLTVSMVNRAESILLTNSLMGIIGAFLPCPPAVIRL